MSSLSKLIEISEDFVGANSADKDRDIPACLDQVYSKVRSLVAFEGALVVYPVDNVFCISCQTVNNDGWKYAYSENVHKTFFFAKDVFGNHYGVMSGNFYKLDQESGKLLLHSTSIDAWAGKILSDYDYETGWSLAHDWQVYNNTRIAVGECLIPIMPFSLGGEFEANNLMKVNVLDALKKYASLRSQVEKVSPGSTVSIRW